MEPPLETGPEQFEIQISDSMVENPTAMENLLNSSENSGLNEPPANCINKASDSEPDLGVRASLSDVVLSQSLQFTERTIDFEDGDKGSNEGYVDEFDSVAVESANAHVYSDIVLTFQDNSSPSKDEFSAICQDSDNTKSGDLSTASAASAQPVPTQVLSSQCNVKSPGFEGPDFEDAFDPPLLTSTLKAAQEESDDEFEFDLPTFKAVNGKSVRFSGGGESAELKEEVAIPKDDEKELDREQKREITGQTVAVAVPSISHIGHSVDTIQNVPVIAEVKMDAAFHGDDAMQPIQDQEDKEDRSHIITSSAADWDHVETVEAGFSDGQAGDGAESLSSVPPLLAFSDVWQHFRSMDHTAVKDKVQVTVEKHGFAALVSRLFGPPKLQKTLHADREVIFCIAATAFDNREEQHLQSLQTIYRVLTGSRFSCQRYGSHWEEIGFQGRDPATDLRGTGMLALVQLVSFLQDDSTAQLARDLYKLSLHPTQNFPFCVMCINMSRISLQALREGTLNRECNSQKKVMPVVNQFYAGTLLHLYRVWKQGKTISDSGFVIREVETRAKKQSKEVFKDLQAYTAAQKASTQGGGGGADRASGGREGDVNFFSVVKSDTKSAAELY